MSYASIIEIVGIKELAEDDFGKFAEKTNDFKISAEQSISNTLHSFDKTSLQVFIFRDHCYVQSDNIDSLLYYLKELRISFFKSTNYFFRSVLTVGDLNIQEARRRPVIVKGKPTVTGEIRFMEYSEMSIRLLAMMERFKGVGIMIDVEKLESDRSWNKLKNTTFTNFYITDITNKKYQSYTDISLHSKDELYKFTKEIFERMYYDKMYSKKLARFYVPLLINLAKNYDLRNDENDFAISKIIGKSIVNRNKDVTGFEFFFYMLIERVFDITYSKMLKSAGFGEEILEVEKNLAKNNWLIDLLRNDSRFSDIPKEILTNSKRRIVLRNITEIIHQIEKS